MDTVIEIPEFDSVDPLLNMTPNQEASLLRGIKDADEGRTTPHEEVMKGYIQWLAK